MKFKTQFNYEPKSPESSKKPSQTVPSLALTVDQILKHSAVGKPIPDFSKKLQYTGDVYFPILETLDLTEREELWKRAQEKISTLNDQLKDENLANKQAKNEADLKLFKELSLRIKAMELQNEDQGTPDEAE